MIGLGHFGRWGVGFGWEDGVVMLDCECYFFYYCVLTFLSLL